MRTLTRMERAALRGLSARQELLKIQFAEAQREAAGLLAEIAERLELPAGAFGTTHAYDLDSGLVVEIGDVAGVPTPIMASRNGHEETLTE